MSVFDSCGDPIERNNAQRPTVLDYTPQLTDCASVDVQCCWISLWNHSIPRTVKLGLYVKVNSILHTRSPDFIV